MCNRIIVALCLIVLALTSCQHNETEMSPCNGCGPGFHTGDLIFIADSLGMGQAVCESTGRYSHVAVVVCQDTLALVYEALPGKGVIKTEVNAWLSEMQQQSTDSTVSILNWMSFMWLDLEFDTAFLVRRLDECLGLPYDDLFLPDNGRLYCSELVQECFRDRKSRPIFASSPMNFRATDGTIPAYWQHHFDSLGVTIPQDTLGTNPTALSTDPRLHSFKIE